MSNLSSDVLGRAKFKCPSNALIPEIFPVLDKPEARQHGIEPPELHVSDRGIEQQT